MTELVPGESKDAGCALCGSTWGNYWREAEGANRFFCCSLCADAWENAVAKLKEKTGWARVDFLVLDTQRGNEADGHASSGTREVRFTLAGTDDGTITRFDIV